MYLTQQALDRVAEGLGIEEVPYFTRNLFGDLAKHGITVETVVVYRAVKATSLPPDVQTALQAGRIRQDKSRGR